MPLPGGTPPHGGQAKLFRRFTQSMDKRTSKENYYLDIADAVLERSTCLRRKYGAIIVRNDEIISTPLRTAL